MPAHRGRRFPTAIEEDKDTKQVSCDYCFMRVSKDFGFEGSCHSMVSAHVVPLKGARLGHCGQVTLKSDQEAAIVDVLREIANLRGSRGTLLEHSPVADSQSNDLIGRGIRSDEEMTRMLLDFVSRVG